MKINRDRIFREIGEKPYVLLAFSDGIAYKQYRSLVAELMYTHNSLGCICRAPVCLHEFIGSNIEGIPNSSKELNEEHECNKYLDCKKVKALLGDATCLLMTFPDGVGFDDFQALVGAFRYGDLLDDISGDCELHQYRTKDLTREDIDEYGCHPDSKLMNEKQLKSAQFGMCITCHSSAISDYKTWTCSNCPTIKHLELAK